MRWPVGLEDGIGLYVDWCISEIPQQVWYTHWFPGLVSGYGHGVLTDFQDWSADMCMVYSLFSRTGQWVWTWYTHWFPGLVSGYGYGILTGFTGYGHGILTVFQGWSVDMDMVYSLVSRTGQWVWTWYTHSFPGLVSGHGYSRDTHWFPGLVSGHGHCILIGFQDWSVDMGIVYSLVSRTGQWTWALYTHYFPGLVSGHGHCILTGFQGWSEGMDMVYSLVSRTGQWAWAWYAVTGRSLPRVAIETTHATAAVVTLCVVLAVL